MTPEYLKIKGLYSYIEEQEIDFSTLTQSALFGIFGTVGSGKSSIIEAITFALYGRTHRMNQSGDNRYYNMLNLKSDRLLIEFRFRAGDDENQYLVTVSGRRNSKRFEDVASFDRQIFRMEKENWLPIEQNELENVIGLSYENFRRTIIIPQGQFQEFLSLSKGDRTKMLKELFQLQRFDLYSQAKRLEDKTRLTRENTIGRLSELGEYDENLIIEARENILKLEKENQEKEAKLKKMRDQEQWFATIKDDFLKLQSLRSQMEKLKLEQAGMNKMQQELKEYETCRELFGDLLQRMDEYAQRLDVLSLQKRNQVQAQQELQSKLRKHGQDFEISCKKFEQTDLMTAHSEAIGHYMKALAAEAEINKTVAAITKGEDWVKNEIKPQKDLLSRETEELQKQIKEKEAQLPDNQRLMEIKLWYQNFLNLLKQQKENYLEEEKIQGKINKIDQGKTEFIDEDFRSYFPEIDCNQPSEEIVRQAEACVPHIETHLEQLRQEHNRLSIEKNVEQLASSIEEGKPCPLCGALEHPNIIRLEDIDRQLTEINNQIEAIKKKLEKEESVVHKLNNIIQGKQLQLGRLNKNQENAQKLKSDIEAHKQSFVWEDYDMNDALKIEVQLRKAEKLRQQVKAERTQLEEKNTQLKQVSETEERAKEKLRGYSQALAALQAGHQENLKNTAGFLAEIQNIPEDKLSDEKEKLIHSVKEIKTKHAFLQEQKSKLQAELGKTEGLIEAGQNEIDQLEQKQKEAKTIFDQKLSESNYSGAEEIKKVLNQKLNTQSIRAQLQKFATEMAVGKERINDLEARLQGRTYQANEHQLLLQSIGETEKNLETGKQQITEKKLFLKEEERKKQVRDGLQKEKEQLDSRLENIKTLKQMFTGQGFVQFVSTVYLENITRQANERFRKLTNQRLSLELDDNQMFIVRDYLNDGRTRNVKTLSGGQMFQASLSLALALSDSVQSLSGTRHRFFFMDEGFGSLDKTALHTVFETLRMLKKENRIVGIISHVEELQQDIDICLHIEMDERRGSLIREGWKN